MTNIIFEVPPTDVEARDTSPVDRALQAFLTPTPPSQRRDWVLEGGESRVLETPEGEVFWQIAGSGPAVLLVHGWQGQAADMAAFAPPLQAAGFTVVVVDLPAHGRSAGSQTAIPQLARALRAVGRAAGPLQAVIAHSMGSAVLVEALHDGLDVQRVVLIAAPARYEAHARAFALASGLSASDAQQMVDRLGAAIGVDMATVSIPLLGPQLRQPALFIHSDDDKVVDIAESLESAAAWPGARHEQVEGLGHRRVLKDPAVIASAVAFATATTAAKEKTS